MVERKYFGIVILVLAILAIGVTMAGWDAAKTVWHSSEDIKVTIEGNNYSLQEAIDDGLIAPPQVVSQLGNNCVHVNTEGNTNTNVSLLVNGQNICEGNFCEIFLWSTDSSGGLKQVDDYVSRYIQDSTGKYFLRSDKGDIKIDDRINGIHQDGLSLSTGVDYCSIQEDIKNFEESKDAFGLVDDSLIENHLCHVIICARR
jgi:hypothetical protein